ncbi:MAG: hypothetical protein GY754_29235, partial [bacterium]|nr:hypothetical protein [bacterium]
LILSFVSCSNVIGDGVEDYLPTTDSGSSGKDILSFESEFQTGAAIIDAENHTIAIEVSYICDLTRFAPTISASPEAAVWPISGQEVDFSSGSSEYIVIAEDSSKATYTVSVTIGANPWQGTVQISSGSWDYGGDTVVDNNGNAYVVGYTSGVLESGATAQGYDIFIIKFNPAGEQEWVRQPGSSGYERTEAVAIDNDGYIYITGYTTGELVPGSQVGGMDIFLIKYDSLGNSVWKKQFGTSETDRGNNVAVDNNGSVYVTGYTNGVLYNDSEKGSGDDIILVKYTTSGTPVWIRQIGSSAEDHGYGLTTDSSGNIYITGRTKGSLNGNPYAGSSDIFLTKFNSSGDRSWTDQFGTSGSDEGKGVAVDKSGNIFITGQSAGNLDGNSNLEFGYSDIFLSRYNSSGKRQWTKMTGSTKIDSSNDITIDSNDFIYISGSTEGNMYGISAGNNDLFLAKYNQSGGIDWSKQLGSSGHDNPRGIACFRSDYIYITGYTQGNLDGNSPTPGRDIFLVQYDSSGIKN